MYEQYRYGHYWNYYSLQSIHHDSSVRLPPILLLLENIWPRWPHIVPRSSSAATIPISPFERRKERINGAGRLALGDETKSDSRSFPCRSQALGRCTCSLRGRWMPNYNSITAHQSRCF